MRVPSTASTYHQIEKQKNQKADILGSKRPLPRVSQLPIETLRGCRSSPATVPPRTPASGPSGPRHHSSSAK